MRTRLVIGSALAAISFAACTSAPAPRDATADLNAINALRSSFETAFNRGDAAALAALYTADAVVMPTHHAAVSGSQAIGGYFGDFMGQMTAQMKITPIETKVVDDLAFDRGTYTMTLTPKAGGAAMIDTGKYLVLLRRQNDGSWKLTHDIDNSDVPMPPPPAPAEPGKGK